MPGTDFIEANGADQRREICITGGTRRSMQRGCSFRVLFWEERRRE